MSRTNFALGILAAASGLLNLVAFILGRDYISLVTSGVSWIISGFSFSSWWTERRRVT